MREGGRLFLSLPVGHSKSDPDQVIVGAVRHPAADSFIVSRLARRAVDYGGEGSGGERGDMTSTQWDRWKERKCELSSLRT